MYSSHIVKQTMCTFIMFVFFIVCCNNTINGAIDNELSDFYKDKFVLVTGGCGFIGSHLVEKLVEFGAYVTVLDDLSSGKLENIASVCDVITLIKKSIVDYDVCCSAASNQDIIFHLAAFLSVPMSVENPQLCHDSNVVGVANILEAARSNNVRQFIFSSSSAVYGECDSVCTEDTLTDPISPYGFSKLIGELYCKEYARVFDMKVVMLRYFNVYGARQNPHAPYAGVVAKFMYNMEHDLPLAVFGDGLQTRDFISVEDVVKANLIMGMLSKDFAHAEIFNIATGKSISVLELIEILKQKYPDYNNEIIFMPPRPGDIKNTSADCSKYYDYIAVD